MVDPVSGQAAAAVTQIQEAQTQISSGPGPVNPDDVSKFAEAMNGPADAAAQAGQVPGSSGNMLNNLDQMSSSLRETQQGIIENTRGLGDMGDLIRTQFEVAQLTTTQTMVGQVGQKTSQGTQQLLKGQ